jgi:tRNA guanosine-2'-O-methyltransferase
MLWDRTLQLFGLPATNLLRLEIYGLIARFFDFYFGTNDASEPIIHKDLRFNVDFFKILQVSFLFHPFYA